MQINLNSPLPLYAQVEDLIRKMMRRREFQRGALLPPETQIAEQLSVSRNTVRAAISRLVQEGLLERKAGLGTRCVKPTTKTNLAHWPSFTREMERNGQKVHVFYIHTAKVKPDENVCAALLLAGTKKREPVLKMERVRGCAKVPAVYSISWFPNRLNLTPEDDFSMPLYDLIKRKSGIQPARSEEEITAILADDSLAEKLHCHPGDPILLRKRIVKDAGNKVIEYNKNYYRPDLFTYELSLNKAPT